MVTKVSKPMIADDLLQFIGDAVAQGFVPIFSSRAAASDYDLSAFANVQIDRWSPASRLAPAQYSQVPQPANATPDHEAWFADTNGIKFELTPTPLVNTWVFGAMANGAEDDLAAIVRGDAFCASKGLALWIIGPHVSSDGIDRASEWVGTGAPQLAPFPLSTDNKPFLRPGFKHLMPGSSIRFVGAGTKTASTQRTDEYSSFTYCVKDGQTGLKMEGLAVILDCDVYDAAGERTGWTTDNRASYDVGRFIDNASRTTTSDVVVFGYFAKAGTVLRSLGGSGAPDNPDYNLFRGGSTMGRHGMALIGSQDADGFQAGLSGTEWFGFNMYTLDHHNRGDVADRPNIYGNADTWRCLYIDGYTDATNFNINGHYFYGGLIRTYAIHPFEFGHASQVNFFGTVFETSNYSDIPNSATKQALASGQTFHVGFRDCRFATGMGLLSPAFGGTMNGVLTIDNCPGAGFGAGLIKSESHDGVANWVKVGGASGGDGDPAIQLGQGPANSSNLGYSIRRDISRNNWLVIQWNGGDLLTLDNNGAMGRTVHRNGNLTMDAAGAITVGGLSYYTIDTYAGAAAQDLITINGGVVGQEIILKSNVLARKPTVVNTGNIKTSGGASRLFNTTKRRMRLMYDGVDWVELSWADNS